MKLPDWDRFSFTGRAFWGSTREWNKIQEIRLHSIMDRAIMLSSGVQQPPSIHEAPNPSEDYEREQTEEEIQKIAGEIYLALTGKDVKDGMG